MKAKFIITLLLVLSLPFLMAFRALQEGDLPVLTVDLISGFTGLFLTIAFSWIPKLDVWFAAKPEDHKKYIMLGLVALFSVAGFALGCYGYLQELFQVTVICDRATAVDFARNFVIALVINQGVYPIVPKSPAVKKLKANLEALKAGAAETYLGRE